MKIFLYLVGKNEDDAQTSLIFDTEKDARNYILDEFDSSNRLNVYCVEAVVNFSSVEEV